MAVLEKIRVRLGVFITILIAVALLSFIIDPNTLSSTIQSKSKSNNVGEMNGKAVSYRDYFTEVENTTRLMEAVGGQSLNNEQAQNQVRNMAWQKFLSDRVFLPKVSDAGFAVSQAEMGDLFAGANVSPIIQNAFAGRDGFNPQTVADFSRQMDMDETGTSRKYWNWLEQQVYSQQMMNKYFAAFTGSTLLSKT
ncbi:MAG: SurA N-terminal domain-containing protein, partial [Bacteroidales bacterium]|nr:SurA N-terminal domain-containing protein [Bacteroidales bacterium]